MTKPDAEETVEIAAPAPDVWALRLDFTRLPEYNPDVSEVNRIRSGSGIGGELGAGACYRFVLATSHGPHPVELAVSSVVEDREVVATMDGALRAREAFQVEALSPVRCRASLALWLELPAGIAPEVAEGVVEGGRRQIRAELDRMNEVLSAPAAPA
ncbi:MAG: SRPBCC family protein [Actinomycetota bacterium]|jgi:hypothetical protein|nr:SRPBCC family protein [Actinomycetota bacterium]